MKRLKQILSILAIALLLGLYLLTFIFALTDHSETHAFLMASVFSTFAVPFFLYAFLMVIRHLEEKRKEEEAFSEDNTSE